jgi:dienelactone hydrolase
MAADAYGAMAYLGTLPFVDPDRIALMGWSQGGAAAFTAVDPTGRVASAYPRAPGFRAVIGVYPHCEPLALSTRVPILLLLGTEDYVTSLCLQGAARMREERKPVRVKTYTGAKHGFDQEPWIEVYDAIATADARGQVRGFLWEYLDPR